MAIAGGGGVNLYNSMGTRGRRTTSRSRANSMLICAAMAAEARAKIVYERLIHFTDDAGTKDALQFLMTREITHMKASRPPWRLSEGHGSLSDRSHRHRDWLISFNDSTGRDEDGDGDAEGPWE